MDLCSEFFCEGTNGQIRCEPGNEGSRDRDKEKGEHPGITQPRGDALSTEQERQTSLGIQVMFGFSLLMFF